MKILAQLALLVLIEWHHIAGKIENCHGVNKTIDAQQ